MMNLGIDIDGTITGDAESFAYLSPAVSRHGVVHVVSSRSPEAHAETVAELTSLH